MRFSAMILGLGLSVTAPHVLAEPPHGGGLPPGLQKKVERGEPLPPGWRGHHRGHDHYRGRDRYRERDHDRDRGRYRVGDRLDWDRYERGNIVFRDERRGHVGVRVEDRVVRVIESTLEIVDVLRGRDYR